MTAGARARRKGVTGERDAAKLFEDAGWTVRGVEGQGDHLCVRSVIRENEYTNETWIDTLHVEVKRQERLRIPKWLAQAKAEAPPGVPPVLVFRQNRGEWVACLPLADLLELIG